MLEDLLKEKMNENGIVFVRTTGEKLRELADKDLIKHGIDPTDTEKCRTFLIEAEKPLSYEEMDRLYEITVGNVNFPLYRITSADVNGYIIKYERMNEREEFLTLLRLQEGEYKELLSLQIRGTLMSVSTKYEDGMPYLWEEFPPHQTFDQEKLVRRIFEFLT